MLGIHMGGCPNKVLCDHLMNYVESLEVNYFFTFPWLLSLFNNVKFRTVLVMWEGSECIAVLLGESKFQKGKGSDTKERSDPYAYSDILSGHHFFNPIGMKS